MQFHDLSLGGFGRLAGATFSFQPGLNFIIGPNEAGKSTLLTAIFTLLYGFFDSGSITSSRRDLLDAYRPWQAGVPYRGWLTFSLHDGRQYRVERGFGSRLTTTLSLLPAGTDVSAQFRGESSGRLYFADELLGMSRTVFESTVCLRQSELARLDKSASAITEAITRLTTSGTGDASAGAAIDLLKLVLRDEIGTPRAWTKPLAVAQKEFERLAQAQEHEVERQRQLWSLTREINQYEARCALLAAQKERLAYLKAIVEQAERRAAVAHLDEARREVDRRRAATAALAQYAHVPMHLRDELLRRFGEWQRQSEQLAQAAARRQQLEAQLADLQARAQQTARQLEGPDYALQPLPAIRDRMVAVHAQWVRAGEDRNGAQSARAAAEAQVASLQRQIESERAADRALLAVGALGLAKLQSTWEEAGRALDEAERRFGEASEAWGQVGMSEAEYTAVVQRAAAVRAGSTPPAQQRGCNPFRRSAPAEAGPPVEVTIADDIAPIHAAGEAASAALDSARVRLGEAEDQVRAVLDLNGTQPVTADLFRASGDRLGTLDKHATQLQVSESERAAAIRRADEAETSLAAVAEKLCRDLSDQGISVHDLERGMAAYLSAFDQQLARAGAAAEAKRLQQQQAGVLEQLEQSRRLQAEWATTEQRIGNLLAEADAVAGATTGAGQSIEQRMDAFHRLCQGHEQWSAAAQELHAAEQQMELLEKISREQGTIHQIEVAERQLQTMLQAQPDWRELEPDQTAADYERLVQEAAAEMQRAEHELVRLRMQKNLLEGQAEPLAALSEHGAMAADQVRRLTRAGAILTKSTELLQDAVTEFQKAFAPRLEVQIAQNLSTVTGSRYHKVRLDPADLAMEVWAPEAAGWVPAERLSTGTRDLVYIVTRTAISDLLGGNNETLPLLLDDPFVHLDSQRERQALAYLAQVAQDRQVLYFSKDSSLPARVRKGPHGSLVIQLT